jgi:hypothetical protein
LKVPREFREFFSSPAFYIIAALFLALSGYRFYSLVISYMDLMSSYPEYIIGGEISSIMGLDPNIFIFPRLFEFYSYLVLLSIPVINIGVGYEAGNSIDKIELMVQGVSEYKYILRKAVVSSMVLMIIVLPTMLYPLILWIFTEADKGLLISSYLGLFLLIFASSCLVSPIGTLTTPISVTVFLNMVVLFLTYTYFWSSSFSPFLYGMLKLSTIVEVLVFSVIMIFVSAKIYQSKRIYS